MFKSGNVPAHTRKSTTADPVRTSVLNEKVKNLLSGSVRDSALWSFATNSMLRSGDLVSLRWDELLDDGECITVRLLEGKTDKRRVIPLPEAVSALVRSWRLECASKFVFSGQRGRFNSQTWGHMVKKWCRDAGLEGNFSGHTTRKTGVRIRYDEHGVSLATLRVMLNHSDETTTLRYMGRMTEDVAKAYAAVI